MILLFQNYFATVKKSSILNLVYLCFHVHIVNYNIHILHKQVSSKHIANNFCSNKWGFIQCSIRHVTCAHKFWFNINRLCFTLCKINYSMLTFFLHIVMFATTNYRNILHHIYTYLHTHKHVKYILFIFLKSCRYDFYTLNTIEVKMFRDSNAYGIM